jgi:hypothetical protein
VPRWWHATTIDVSIPTTSFKELSVLGTKQKEDHQFDDGDAVSLPKKNNGKISRKWWWFFCSDTHRTTIIDTSCVHVSINNKEGTSALKHISVAGHVRRSSSVYQFRSTVEPKQTNPLRSNVPQYETNSKKNKRWWCWRSFFFPFSIVHDDPTTLLDHPSWMS